MGKRAGWIVHRRFVHFHIGQARYALALAQQPEAEGRHGCF